MDAKHTPGPLEIDPDDKSRAREAYGRHRPVCECYGDGQDEREANARLHAAAPDLLAACRKAESLLRIGNDPQRGARGIWPALVTTLRAALAKAEPTP